MGNFNRFWLVQKANDFLDGFSNTDKGWSGKKQSAAAIVVCGICYPLIRWTNWAAADNDWSLLIPVLGFCGGIVLSLFAANIVDKFKNPIIPKDSPPTTP